MVNWHLLPGELKIYETKTSWKVFFKFYFLGALFLAFGAAVWFAPLVPMKALVSIVLSFLFILTFFVASRKRGMERVLITNERILIRKASGSWVNRQVNVETVTFNNLINVRVLQNRSQKLLNVGDVVFKLSGDEHAMTGIDNPYGVERAVYKIIEKEKASGQLAKQKEVERKV